jgi:hypothetical protein
LVFCKRADRFIVVTNDRRWDHEDKRVVACGHVDILSREPKREILEVKLMTNQRHYPRSNLSFIHRVALRRLAN